MGILVIMDLEKMIRSGWFQVVSVGVTVALLYHAFFGAKYDNSDCFKFTRVGWDKGNFYVKTVDLGVDEVRFVWKDGTGARYGSIGAWRDELEEDGRDLVFAMNGGMYKEGGAPKGLFIEKGEVQSEIDFLEEGYGNFYMQPNGVFFITNDGVAGICKTENFSQQKKVRFATQSGPMLLIDGEINENFRLGSDNKHIRNGVGLLEDGRLVFAMSKVEVSFYDFAYFLKERRCRNALYLDGFVSRMYAPESGVEQLDGDFGVMIGVVKGE